MTIPGSGGLGIAKSLRILRLLRVYRSIKGLKALSGRGPEKQRSLQILQRLPCFLNKIHQLVYDTYLVDLQLIGRLQVSQHARVVSESFEHAPDLI